MIKQFSAFKHLALGMSAMILAACTAELNKEDVTTPGGNDGLVKEVRVTAEDMVWEDGLDTKTAYNSNLAFTWAAGDVLGIFPVGGNQVDFPISNGIGTNSALFDGGKWALRAADRYAAYYPFNEDYYKADPTYLIVSFLDQKAFANDDPSNLSSYDYMASAAQPANSKGSIDMTMKHLVSFARFQITLPTNVTVERIGVHSDKVFTSNAYFDITAETPRLITCSRVTNIYFDVDNVATSNRVITLYYAFAPGDFSGHTLTIGVADTNGNYYEGTVAGKNMEAGKAYGYSVTNTVKKDSYAVLTTGEKFSSAVKSVRVGTYIPYDLTDIYVKNIEFQTNQSTIPDITDLNSTTRCISVADKNESIFPVVAYYDHNVSTVYIKTKANSIKVKSGSRMFYQLQNVSSIKNLNCLDTSEATSISEMFSYCGINNKGTSFILDLDGFDTSNVKDFSYMFHYCGATEIHMENATINSATTMRSMFYDAQYLKYLDIYGFDLYNKPDDMFTNMFKYCASSLPAGQKCKVNIMYSEWDRLVGNSAINGINTDRMQYDGGAI